jgi:hypothetical protein
LRSFIRFCLPFFSCPRKEGTVKSLVWDMDLADCVAKLRIATTPATQSATLASIETHLTVSLLGTSVSGNLSFYLSKSHRSFTSAAKVVNPCWILCRGTPSMHSFRRSALLQLMIAVAWWLLLHLQSQIKPVRVVRHALSGQTRTISIISTGVICVVTESDEVRDILSQNDPNTSMVCTCCDIKSLPLLYSPHCRSLLET